MDTSNKKVRAFIQSTRMEIAKGGNIKKVLGATATCPYGQYHCIRVFSSLSIERGWLKEGGVIFQ